MTPVHHVPARVSTMSPVLTPSRGEIKEPSLPARQGPGRVLPPQSRGETKEVAPLPLPVKARAGYSPLCVIVGWGDRTRVLTRLPPVHLQV
jgi:hypothetical protein